MFVRSLIFSWKRYVDSIKDPLDSILFTDIHKGSGSSFILHTTEVITFSTNYRVTIFCSQENPYFLPDFAIFPGFFSKNTQKFMLFSLAFSLKTPKNLIYISLQIKLRNQTKIFLEVTEILLICPNID